MTTDLQEAFREAARREFAMVPDENELDYTFSPGFQRKMRRIIRAQVHGYWNMVNTLGKRIAIAAAIIVMLLTTAMAIKPIRERVIKFFVEVYEEYFEFTFGITEKNDISSTPVHSTQYTITHLPPEYQQTEVLELDQLLWTRWENPTGGRIILCQEPGSHAVLINNAGDFPNDMITNNKQVYYQLANDMDIFLWSQDGYIFRLTIYDQLSLEQSQQIINSLNKKISE